MLFKDKIKITGQGKCHLGLVIGTESSKEQSVKSKVEDWVKDHHLLVNNAQDDLQAAYSAFTKGLCSTRWTISKVQYGT